MPDSQVREEITVVIPWHEDRIVATKGFRNTQKLTTVVFDGVHYVSGGFATSVGHHRQYACSSVGLLRLMPSPG